MDYIDQLSRTISLHRLPKRIVSVVPSQTELLFDLGLSDEVVGITKFCIHPEEWFRSKTRIGGTKHLNIEKIRSLNPDLIIANKEENEENQIKELMSEFPVWISDIHNLDDALSMIASVSEITGKNAEGEKITSEIRSKFENLQIRKEKIPCLYLIWKEPMMAAGADTFISDMLNKGGFTNLLHDKSRYPEISADDIDVLNPEIIFLSSEPYPFKEKDRIEFKAKFPTYSIMLADGEMFSWYGSRLLKSPAYFSELRDKIETAL